MTALINGLVVAVILMAGISSGVTFIFSNTVMKALARQGPDAGAAAMEAINEVILNPLFFLVFIASGFVAAAAAVLAVAKGHPGAGLIVAGAALYLGGMVGITATANVPMNDQLAAVTLGTEEARAYWAHYLDRWTFWNTARTIAGAAAVVLLTLSRSGG
jgi:uncharacterized membrane protein